MLAEILSWSVGATGAVGTIYGLWLTRKSKRMVKVEEDAEMLDNADKIVTMWEKLSANYIKELDELKSEFKAVNQKYTELRIEFEVEKSKSTFMLEQYKMQISQKDAEISLLKTEVENYRTIVGQGIISPLSVTK